MADLPDESVQDMTLEQLKSHVLRHKHNSLSSEVACAEAYHQALTRMQDPTFPPEQLSVAIQMGQEFLLQLVDHLPALEYETLRFGFGLLAGEVLAQRLQDVACVDGTWQPSVRAMVQCFSNWKVDHPRDGFERQSATLKQWMYRMLQDGEYCPDVSLRLNMLSLVSLWSTEEVKDSISMAEVRLGIISICSDDRLDYLRPSRSHPSRVLSHFVQVLIGLQRWGHMDVVSAAAKEQAQLDHVGPETLCLMRIMDLTGEVAVETRAMDTSTRTGVRHVLYVLGNVMALFSVMLMSNPLLSAFEGSCLSESAAASLVKATGAVLACMPTSHPNEDIEEFVYILTVMDVMMFSVNTRDELRSLKHVMHISHFYTLADLYEYSKKIGYPFRRKLAKFNERCNEICPDR